MPFRHLNVFSGSGAFEMAAEAVGWENIASCEINRFANEHLQRRFGHTIHTDARSTNWRQYRGVCDVLSLSPNCQPWSSAGAQRGPDDDRDHLELSVGILDQVRPRAAVLENVRGLITWKSGMALRQLVSALEGAGYSALPLFVAAGSVGAIHQRFRLWLVAYSYQKRQPTGYFPTFTGTPETWKNVVPDHLFDEQRRYAASQPDFLGIHDGFPRWVDASPSKQISLMGNALVPQVAIPIFKAIDAALRADT